MPRRSAEAVAADSAALEPVERQKPPKTLKRHGRQLWLRITHSKPANYFDAADLPQLEEACVWEDVAQGLMADGLASDDDEKRLARARDKQRAALRGLRLTKQASWQANDRAAEKKTSARPWLVDGPDGKAEPARRGVH